jgi:alkylhydroperoxidase family enzyme
MSRIAPPTDLELDDAARAILARRPAVAVYRATAHAPALLGPFVEIATAFFEHTSLGARLREMVILRVAMHHTSRSEAHHHRGLAARAGVSDAEIQALLSPRSFETPDAVEAAAIRLVDEVIAKGNVSSASFERLASALGPRGTTELALLIGFYRMVATFIAILDLQPDEKTAVELRDANRAPST